jgi:hypothetical protein
MALIENEQTTAGMTILLYMFTCKTISRYVWYEEMCMFKFVTTV